jgi:MFS transporter, FHS family, glucose/mannose:H+ symporter
MNSTWKIKLSLFLNYFVFAILLNSVGTVILQMQNNFGVSHKLAANLEGFKDGSIAIASFLIASYIVRIGYKNSMLFGLAFVSLLCLLMPSLPSFFMIKVLFACVGVSFAIIKISVFGTLGLISKTKKEHISLMNFLESFFGVGVVSGYFIFASFVDNNNPKSTEWFNVYYLLAGMSIAAFLLLFFTKLDESSVREKEKSKPLANEFIEMLRMIIVPLVFLFIFCAFFYVLIEQSIMSWLPTFNKDVLHLSTSLSIQMASILSISIAAGRFLAGFLLKKVDWLPVLVCCLLMAAAIVFITVPLTRGLSITQIDSFKGIPAVAFAFPVIGLFLAPIYPAINSVILSNIPVHKHAAMSGLIVVFSALGGFTGSKITGYVFGAYGGQTAFYLSLIPIAILVLLLFFFKRLQKNPVDESKIEIKTGH